MTSLQAKVTKRGERIWQGTCQLPLFIGRQAVHSDSGPVSIMEDVQLPSGVALVTAGTQSRKLVIAPFDEQHVPRWALFVDAGPDAQRLALRNIHSSLTFELQNTSTGLADAFAPGAMRIVDASTAVRLAGGYEVHLELAGDNPQSDPALRTMMTHVEPFRPFAQHQRTPLLAATMHSDLSDARGELGLQLVETVLSAFQKPPGSLEFFRATCEAAIRLLGLDRVLLLLCDGHNWDCHAEAFKDAATADALRSQRFSRSLIAELQDTRKTIIVEPQQGNLEMLSLTEMERAVGAPLLDASGELLGALYGDKAIISDSPAEPITDIEAKMLEILASGIASSLVVEREQKIRLSMSQFFSPAVLSNLQDNQELLRSKHVEAITILFCDIRGFSAVTKEIGHTTAIEWVHDVLTSLSECVIRHDGVLVDYIGDELMAMWGAPTEQPDHAELACRAARDMLNLVDSIREKWADVVPGHFGFGIGINSGEASVGNTGSRQKFKYGALGNTVNVASRVQGLTKQMGVRSIITESTRSALGDSLPTRRLTQVEVVGIPGAFGIYELIDEHQRDFAHDYESALSSFEANHFDQAASQLASLVSRDARDRPTVMLLGRTVERLSKLEPTNDPVWRPTEK